MGHRSPNLRGFVTDKHIVVYAAGLDSTNYGNLQAVVTVEGISTASVSVAVVQTTTPVIGSVCDGHTDMSPYCVLIP